jgi:carbamoyltransferase
LYILGISCWFHDSAACLIKNGIPIAAAEEERFTRIKHDNNFPENAIKFCLKYAKISPNDLDFVVFYEKPMLKLERILQMVVENYPRSFPLFYEAIPSWANEKLRLPGILRKKFGYKGKVLFVKHHASHASSAFFPSPFKEAAIITIDALGEYTTTAIHYGIENKIKTLKEIHFPNSLGLFYSTITSYLGFKVNNDEYKVMALASYGKPRYYKDFKKIIDVKPDGSFKLNTKYFTFIKKDRMFSDKLEEKFGPARKPDEPIQKKHMDIAATLQKITEEIVLKIAKHAYELTKCENLCIAGGVGFNSVANGKILKENIFKNIFVQPAAGDAGGALGAALYVYNQVLNNKRNYVMKDVYLGPEFSNKEIESFLNKNSADYEKLSDSELVKEVANLLAEGKSVGWFQGRMEFSYRALGNRSILADPSNPEMREKVGKIKKREWFRPFAPTILFERIDEYYTPPYEAPFMIITFDVKEKKKKDLIAVLHVDGTTRPQSLRKEVNERYYKLIKEFEKIKGIPALLNTSFNRKGEPIVCKPEEAYRDLVETPMDYLVLGNFLIKK